MLNFNHAAKAIEIEGIEARVAALEQAAASGRNSHERCRDTYQ